MKKEKILLPKRPSAAGSPWLWIGTWSMGGEGFGHHDERESLRALWTAAENNIRYFDTAGFYAHGTSEKLLQQIIKTEREEFYISSKGGLVWNGRKVEHQASPEALTRQLYESFDRLKTDYLDLYQLHWPDPKVPMGESIAALSDLKKKGLIRSWGVGNLTDYDLYHYLDGEKDIPHQVHFNPVHRNFNILHAGDRQCINCIISPLEQGLLVRDQALSDKGRSGKNDIRKRNPYFSDLKVLLWCKKFNELLNHHRVSKVSMILLWICTQPQVHVIIPGPRMTTQLDELLMFRAEVEEYGLLASVDEDSIISREKASEVVPADIWKLLSKGP